MAWDAPARLFIPPVKDPCTITAHHHTIQSRCCTTQVHACTTKNRTMHPRNSEWKYFFTCSVFSNPFRRVVFLDTRKRRFYLLSASHKTFMEGYKDLINACYQLSNQWSLEILNHQIMRKLGPPKANRANYFANPKQTYNSSIQVQASEDEKSCNSPFSWYTLPGFEN